MCWDNLSNLPAHPDSERQKDSPSTSFALVAEVWLAVNDVMTLFTFLGGSKDGSVVVCLHCVR